MTDWYQTHVFSRFPLSSESPLPPLSVIALNNLALITATGSDTINYLQGQLTCDLVSLSPDHSTLAAHCDAKGKMWSILRLFHHNEGIAYTLPASVAEKQLTEIKKYAVFSKVIFEQNSHVLIGIAGDKANKAISLRFPGNTLVRKTKTGTAVQISGKRWLMVIDPQEANDLIQSLGSQVPLCDHTLWDLYELQDGIPQIEENTTNQFIPQAVNLQLLDGISFKKGCYTGQETIARAKYRGINKRAAYLLQGETTVKPNAGETFDRRVGESWRTGGTVLSSYQYSDNQAIALVILPNNLEEDSIFRQADQHTEWRKITMPYDIDNDV